MLNIVNYKYLQFKFQIKMTPFGAYFLGLFTFLIIIIPFWLMSLFSKSIKNAYQSSICYKICPDVGAPTSTNTTTTA